jgi:hypothetical protein
MILFDKSIEIYFKILILADEVFFVNLLLFHLLLYGKS